jgi:tripartite-type tricarboxylate transporter receptor subunit TctC
MNPFAIRRLTAPIQARIDHRLPFAIFCSLVLAAVPASAADQATKYPERPVRLIDPYAPGGGSGLIARVVGAKLSEAWGKQVVVDNRPGAAAAIGTEILMRSAPDGYTLGMGTSGSIAISPNMNKVPYDPVKDLIAITQTSAQSMVAVVHPTVPIHSVKDLIAQARANPNKLIYASSGSGGSGHLAVELFQALAKITMTHVPYKGNGPAVIAQLAGEVQLGFNNMLAVLPHAQSGRLRALAVTSAKRSPSLPNLPTMAEAGVAGYEATSWNGIFAPARTPRPIVDKIHAEVVKILRTPDIREKLVAAGSDPVGSTPAEFQAYVKLELGRWGKLIRDNGIKGE